MTLISRILVAAAAVGLAATTVVAQQDDPAMKAAKEQQALMKSFGRPHYGVVGRMGRGQSPYDQAAIDAAIAQIEEGVGKIAATFNENSKSWIPDADYGPSPKVWENKADFDSRIPPVLAAIKESKGKITDAASAKVAFDNINGKCNACHDTYQLNLKKK
jgi:cytochrome c556